MSQKTYFSQYQSPNIVIVPTVSFCEAPPPKKTKFENDNPVTPQTEPSSTNHKINSLNDNNTNIIQEDSSKNPMKLKRSWASNFLNSIGQAPSSLKPYKIPFKKKNNLDNTKDETSTNVTFTFTKKEATSKESSNNNATLKNKEKENNATKNINNTTSSKLIKIDKMYRHTHKQYEINQRKRALKTSQVPSSKSDKINSSTNNTTLKETYKYVSGSSCKVKSSKYETANLTSRKKSNEPRVIKEKQTLKKVNDNKQKHEKGSRKEKDDKSEHKLGKKPSASTSSKNKEKTSDKRDTSPKSKNDNASVSKNDVGKSSKNHKSSKICRSQPNETEVAKSSKHYRKSKAISDQSKEEQSSYKKPSIKSVVKVKNNSNIRVKNRTEILRECQKFKRGPKLDEKITVTVPNERIYLKSPIKTNNKLKSKKKKYKKIKFVINLVCKNKEDSFSETDSSVDDCDNSVLPNEDLSFLDDFDVDEIVDSLSSENKINLVKNNMQNQFSTKINLNEVLILSSDSEDSSSVQQLTKIHTNKMNIEKNDEIMMEIVRKIAYMDGEIEKPCDDKFINSAKINSIVQESPIIHSVWNTKEDIEINNELLYTREQNIDPLLERSQSKNERNELEKILEDSSTTASDNDVVILIDDEPIIVIDDCDTEDMCIIPNNYSIKPNKDEANSEQKKFNTVEVTHNKSSNNNGSENNVIQHLKHPQKTLLNLKQLDESPSTAENSKTYRIESLKVVEEVIKNIIHSFDNRNVINTHESAVSKTFLNMDLRCDSNPDKTMIAADCGVNSLSIKNIVRCEQNIENNRQVDETQAIQDIKKNNRADNLKCDFISPKKTITASDCDSALSIEDIGRCDQVIENSRQHNYRTNETELIKDIEKLNRAENLVLPEGDNLVKQSENCKEIVSDDKKYSEYCEQVNNGAVERNVYENYKSINLKTYNRLEISIDNKDSSLKLPKLPQEQIACQTDAISNINNNMLSKAIQNTDPEEITKQSDRILDHGENIKNMDIPDEEFNVVEKVQNNRQISSKLHINEDMTLCESKNQEIAKNILNSNKSNSQNIEIDSEITESIKKLKQLSSKIVKNCSLQQSTDQIKKQNKKDNLHSVDLESVKFTACENSSEITNHIKNIISRQNICDSNEITMRKKDNSKIENRDATKTCVSTELKNSAISASCSNETTNNNKSICTKQTNTNKQLNTSSKGTLVNTARSNIISETGKQKMQKIEIRMSEYLRTKYTIDSLIRSGRYSVIYKCTNTLGQNYALKMIKRERDRYNLGIEKEKMLIKLQSDIPKDNIFFVYLINAFSFVGQWCFLMEYYPMNLREALVTQEKPFHIDLVQELARQLVSAVTTLRYNNIVHSDIKPTHILLNASLDKVKLCGFDASYSEEQNKEIQLLPNIGTCSYRAPEIIIGFSAGYSIDVWSTALVLFEMATCIKLFPGSFNNDILYKQMCTLGVMPQEIINMSIFKDYHFRGTLFMRRTGLNGQEVKPVPRFNKNNRLYTGIYKAYTKYWKNSCDKVQREKYTNKLHIFHRLLEQMLTINPLNRLTIEFVYANPFIYDLHDC